MSRRTLVALLVAQGVAIAPLFIELSAWLMLVWLVAMVWRVQIFRGVWSYPTSSVKAILAAICIGGLLVSYMGTLSLAAMVALLVVSVVLKLTEVRTIKDVRIVLLVNVFVTASQYLFFQGVVSGMYGLFALLVTFTAWMTPYYDEDRAILPPFKHAALLLIQALPVTLILFVAVPRMNPLWQMPLPKNTGKTGFSSAFAPGDISRLAQSDDIAFRASFYQSEPLKQSALYWRGLVLQFYDGRNWLAGRYFNEAQLYYRAKMQTSNQMHKDWRVTRANEASIQYDVLLEAHQQPWLFTLSTPLSLQSNSLQTGFR